MKKILFIFSLSLIFGCSNNQKKELKLENGSIETYKINYDKSKVSEYSIENTENSSMKAITKNLSEYSSLELKDLPYSKRQILRVVVPTKISKENLKNTLKHIVKNKTKANNDIDEIIIFAFDNKNDIESFYTFGKLVWAPNGKLGNITPNIAKNNIRNQYKFKIDIKDKVGNINKSDIPTKRELEIYNEVMSEKYWDMQENDMKKIVMKKFNIKSEKEFDRICLKVGAYKLF
jgi:hypothetical protein